MECGRCKDCAFWERAGTQGFLGGRCMLSGTTDGKPNFPDGRAFARDPYAEEAWLETMPDFGCNQFARDHLV